MKTSHQQFILIVEPNVQLREEVVNFLLSAGYEQVEQSASLSAALDKIRQSAYDVVVAGVGRPTSTGLQFATTLAQRSPNTRIILMIEAEDQQSWDQIAPQFVEAQFLIKTDFARNLLHLLEKHAKTLWMNGKMQPAILNLSPENALQSNSGPESPAS
jgi:DNA-binding NtrC family response regulator